MSELIQGTNVRVEAWIKFNSQTQSPINNPQRKSSQDHQRNQNQQFYQNTSKNHNFMSALFQNPLNAPHKLVMHSFSKFKSFSFHFSRIFIPKHQIVQISQQLRNSIYQNLYAKNLPNFCGIGIGGHQSGIKKLIQGNTLCEGLFYSAIIKLIEKLKKTFTKNTEEEDQIKVNFNFVSILQNSVIDLLNPNKKIYLANDISSNKKFDYYLLKPLIFQGGTSYEFTSAYDFYTILKKVYQVKRQIKDWSLFAMQISISTTQNMEEVKNILLVEWQKTPKKKVVYSKMFQSEKPLLSLNQSILQLYKFKQKRYNYKAADQHNLDKNDAEFVYKKSEITELKNIQSFRNSAITRILKPYLLFDSKIIVIGCCSLNQNLQNDSYQTLMFCKHISKVASFAKFKQSKLKNHNLQEYDIQKLSSPISHQKNQRQIIKLDSPAFLHMRQDNQQKEQTLRQKVSNKKYQIRSQTAKFSQIKDPVLIKKKLQRVLTQMNEKQVSPEQQITDLLKKQHQKKRQLLQIKKQQFVLSAKQKKYNLKDTIGHSLPSINKKNKNQRQDEQKIQRFQLKRLNQEQNSLQSQIQQLDKQISKRLYQISSKEDETHIKSTYAKNKQSLQSIKILRNHLKTQLQLIQQETNLFLQGKEQVKKVYQKQLLSMREQQNQLLKKITRKTQPILQRQIQGSKQIRDNYKSLQFSRQKKVKFQPLRLIKQMEPFFNQGKHNFGRKYIKKHINFNTIETDSPQPKKLKKLIKTIQNEEEDGRSIKLSRSLVKRKLMLKDKLKKGRVELNSFLDEAVNKYSKYGQK